MIVEFIKSGDQLLDALEFTKLHHWAEIDSAKLCEKLLYINRPGEVLGVVGKNGDGSIIGSLLLIKQGSLELESSVMTIYNMSAWIILKNYRGPLAFKMLSFALKSLPNSCITNFTPSLPVVSTIQRFGFSNLNAKKIIVPGFFHFPLGLINYSRINVSFSSTDEINNRIPPWSRKFSNDYDAIFLTIGVGKDAVVLGGIMGVNSKKLIGFKWSIRYFSIYWISDDALFSEMANKIIFKISRFLKIDYITISTTSKYYSNLGFFKSENFFAFNNSGLLIDPIGSELFL